MQSLQEGAAENYEEGEAADFLVITFNSEDDLLDSVESEILVDKKDEQARIACWEKVRPALVDLLHSSALVTLTEHNCEVHKDQIACGGMDSYNAHFTAAVDRFVRSLAECSG